MKRVLLHGVLAAMVLGVAACGEGAPGADDEGGGGGGGGNNDAPMDSQSADRAGSAIASSAETGARAFDVRVGASFVCDSVTSSGDLDGDGVPDYAAIEHEDCSKMTPWGQGLVTGDELLVDNDPENAGIDYSLAQDLDIALDTSGATVSFDSAQVAVENGGVFQMDEASDTDITTPSSHTQLEIAWSKEYAPASAWKPGDAAVAGTLSFAGAYEISYEDANGSSEILAAIETLTPLTIDPACPTLVVAGSLHAVVGDGNDAQILEVTWTGCNASGTELLPAL